MTIDQARIFAQALNNAADAAEAAGRERLLESDLDIFAEADDEARKVLQAAIERAI